MRHLFLLIFGIFTSTFSIFTDSVKASWCNLNVDDALDYSICEQEYKKSGYSNYCNLNYDNSLDYSICEHHWRNNR